jgi:aryl-alcohol dehydrogenase-like predicted oxidoreductase
MQNHYNLVYREEEREMNPYCARNGIALTPWSPLARGILAGAYRGNFERGTTARSQGADHVRTESLYQGEHVFGIAERVVEVAARYGRSPAQIALAWLLSKPEVTAPVVGVSRIEQLEQLVAATEITLDPADIAHLEALYRPVENLLSIGYS